MIAQAAAAEVFECAKTAEVAHTECI